MHLYIQVPDFFVDSGEISRANKLDGSDYQSIHNRSEGITDLLVYHYLKQKQTNQCATSNGGCSHLCLALPAEGPGEHVRYTCACPTHFTLHNNECHRKFRYQSAVLLNNYCLFLFQRLVII